MTEHRNDLLFRVDEPISRRKALKYLSSLGLGMAAAYITSCTPGSPSAPTPTASPSSSSVVVYSALNDTTNSAIVSAFRSTTTGLDIRILPIAASGDLQNRIRNEKSSPQADIFVGGSSEYHDALAKEGLLEAYRSPNASAIDPKYVDPDGFWTGWYIGIFGFVLNPARFGKDMAGVARPSNWDDLISAAWKGRLVMPDPARTGGGYIFLATQVFRFNRDEDKAMEFMQKLNTNVAQYVAASPQGIQLVAEGQYIGGPNWTHDILTAKKQGQPVELIIPDMTGFELGAISIVKGGPNPQDARRFVDWILTKETGELNVQVSNRLSTRTDVAPAAGAPTLDQVQLVDYDRAWASTNQARLIQRWRAAVGQ